ncbi:DNA repair protein RecO [mine drainage metagenome]|uniref:DNA repair protein RecO n=1 Tax=mine drainage metagenome TaxID=410659 RepID=A0A1J5QXU6_9ZZZZ
MCGFYLNELLLRLLPREDAHEELFSYYARTLHVLAAGEDAPATLRRFELRLLQQLGYALPLAEDAKGADIQPELDYRYVAEHGALLENEAETGVQLAGKTLLDMAREDYADPVTQQQSKLLMRNLLAHHLGDKPLYTRQLLMDLQEL